MNHITQIGVSGSTHRPGDFTWRCRCGASGRGYERFDLAEEAARDHTRSKEDT